MQDKSTKQTSQGGRDPRTELKLVMQLEKLSLRRICEQIGVSTGALSPWLAGKYAGSDDAIADKVQKYLDRREAVAAMPVPERERFSITVETEVNSTVTKAITHCQLKGLMGIITANSGAGKTRSAREYVAMTPGAVLIECHPSFPARMLLMAIARECGLEARGTIHELLQSISSKLKGSGRVLVIDEAEHLEPKVLDVIRRIHDWAEIGVVYIGLPRLEAQLRNVRRDYEYIWNRVSVKESIDRSKKVELDDIGLVLEMMLDLFPNDLPAAFHRFCAGDIRKFEQLFFACLSVSRKSSKEFSGVMVTAVAQQLKLEVI